MKSTICFIRHGITEGNEKRWYYGAADIPLLEKGIDDLKKLAAQGIYPSPTDAQFFITGLMRTRQTLEAIYGEVEYVKIPELNEMNFGIYECKSFDDLESEEAFLNWCNDESGNYVLEGGESRNQFAERIGCGLKLLIKYHGLKELSHRHSGKDATSIMACHGGAISAAMTLMFSGEEKTIWDWCPEPGHGYKVFFEKGEPVGYERF